MVTKRKSRGMRALLGAALAAGVAMAAPAAAYAAPANVDPNAPVSLTVTKMSSPTTDVGVDYGNGSEIPGLPGQIGVELLEGVTFGIQKVETYQGKPVDLTRTEGWDVISPAMKQEVPFDVSQATLGATSDLVTDAKGEARWSSADGNLELGAYWVTELDPGAHEIVEPIKPFLVTVPAPSAETAGVWLYDVFAYPKNVIMTAGKTVDDLSATAIGDVLNWEITASIPSSPHVGVTLNKVEFIDKLPAETAYEWTSGAHNKVKVLVDAPANANTPLVENTHYTVEYGAATHTLTMKLTETGRSFVQGIITSQGGDIKMQYSTKVINLGVGGVIKNDAVVIVNDADIAVEDETYFGPLRLVKYTEKSESNPTGTNQEFYDSLETEKKLLAGGEFQVFGTQVEAQAAADAVKAGTPTTGAIAVEPLGGGAAQTTFVSDDAGIVDIAGLKTAPGGVTYWVVETKAPVGYYANHDPIEVQVLPNEAHSINDAFFVFNSQNPPLNLPVTGGTMQTILIGTGVALILVGGGAALLLRRKRASGGAA